jgi:hypothetical protein
MDKQEQDLYLAFLCARLDVRLVQLSDYVVANDADIVSTARTGSRRLLEPYVKLLGYIAADKFYFLE